MGNVAKNVRFLATQGFAHFLAERVRKDPRSAAEWIPKMEKEPQTEDALICETLRWVTGKNLGLDLEKWREYLEGEGKQ